MPVWPVVPAFRAPVVQMTHEANRDVLQTMRAPTRVVRSPARLKPLGLHPVTVREIDGPRLKIGPIEAFDGIPVVDIKSASTRADG